MEKEYDKSGWVVLITASNAHYVGKTVGDLDPSRKTVTLSPGFNWLNESVMAGPGQMMMMRQPTPLGPTLESSVITIDYIGIQHIDRWDEDTKEDFFAQVDNLLQGMMHQRRQRRLEKSNIVVPQANVSSDMIRDILSKK